MKATTKLIVDYDSAWHLHIASIKCRMIFGTVLTVVAAAASALTGFYAIAEQLKLYNNQEIPQHVCVGADAYEPLKTDCKIKTTNVTISSHTHKNKLTFKIYLIRYRLVVAGIDSSYLERFRTYCQFRSFRYSVHWFIRRTLSQEAATSASILGSCGFSQVGIYTSSFNLRWSQYNKIRPVDTTS